MSNVAILVGSVGILDLDVFGIVMGAFLRRLQIWCSHLYTLPNWVVILELLSIDL